MVRNVVRNVEQNLERARCMAPTPPAEHPANSNLAPDVLPMPWRFTSAVIAVKAMR